MSKVDSKYTLVHLAARRAREINNYYHSLGEGLGQYVRPLVEQVDSNKPLSIALEEIAAEKIVPHYPGDPQAQAEALLASDLLEGDLLDPGLLGGQGLGSEALGGLDPATLSGDALESSLGGDLVPLDLDDTPKFDDTPK